MIERCNWCGKEHETDEATFGSADWIREPDYTLTAEALAVNENTVIIRITESNWQKTSLNNRNM